MQEIWKEHQAEMDKIDKQFKRNIKWLSIALGLILITIAFVLYKY